MNAAKAMRIHWRSKRIGLNSNTNFGQLLLVIDEDLGLDVFDSWFR